MSELHDLGLRFGALSSSISGEGLTVHYGGPSPWGSSVDRSSADSFAATAAHDRCASIVRAWHAYHLSKGWAGLAYSSCTCPHGHRYNGRGPGRRTAANGTNDGNRRSYATCYIAGVGDPLTDPAKVAFGDEAARLAALRWSHKDWKETACPGDPLHEWRRAGFPMPTPATPPPVVSPDFDPPIVQPPTVSVLAPRDGKGVWQLGRDGSVFAWCGAPYFGGANGKLYFLWRTAAKLFHSDDERLLTLRPGAALVPGKYVIESTSGEFYGPDF